MTTTLRVVTTVQPGNRIEITAPELPVGDTVEVTVTVLTPPARDAKGILDFLDSLPPGPRSAPTWEEVDRRFQEDRDSWDR